jgi:hypothetical protein
MTQRQPPRGGTTHCFGHQLGSQVLLIAEALDR